MGEAKKGGVAGQKPRPRVGKGRLRRWRQLGRNQGPAPRWEGEAEKVEVAG